jgi:ubiquinone/menaquinone biosynthesis C-methylase UbiE
VFRQTAHVYDLIYEASGKDYAAESSEIHALIQQHNPGARTLLDVACGTDRGHLRHLRRWYDVTGVDLDPAMLREARKHLPGIRLAEDDMRTLRHIGSSCRNTLVNVNTHSEPIQAARSNTHTIPADS